ncbi:MAG: beta-galactosidase trimerization domain-containing protein [Anaerolineae bacterium]
MQPLCTRQVHLDFHTAGMIPDVGADFDPAAFVETLQRGHVNSVTVFARCHHGYIYYMPTRYPALHPALKIDLLGEQITACHRAGIRAPIYITVGLDEFMANQHPEWLEMTTEGKPGLRGPLDARWHKMCFNAPYIDYVYEQTMEVMDLFGSEVDGFFFDIIGQGECLCQNCIRDMRVAGLNPEISEDRQRFARDVIERYRRRFSDGILERKPDVTVFHNRGHVEVALRPTLDCYTHLELESLPSHGQWGYNHFPITARYAQTLDKPLLGMTGKFHTFWGDFGSFKNVAALEYECFQMLAAGAVCSVGDQLHPRGRLNVPAYDLIGQVYAQLEAVESWTAGAIPQAEIAVLNLEAVNRHDGWVDTAHSGVLRMLMEDHQQFQFVDAATDWNAYRLLILPDRACLDVVLADKLRAYLDGGGKVIASYLSGLTPDGTRMALNRFGVAYTGEAPWHPDYVTARPELGADLADTEYVMYDRATSVVALPGTQVLADAWAPYFNRTWDHFCSHQHTPPKEGESAGYPAITLNAAGNVCYLAHPVFAGYRRQAPLWYKKLFLACLHRLLPEPMLTIKAPSTMQTALQIQPEQGRTVVHLLHYIPERRSTAFDTIEDIIPLYNLALALKTDKAPSKVYLAPQMTELSFRYSDGYVRVVVPEVMGHQLVVAE